MKVFLLTILVLLLCSTQVLALRCYTCNQALDDCKVETECPESAQYCKTVMHAGDIVSRTCQLTCMDDDMNTSCCQGDLCT